MKERQGAARFGMRGPDPCRGEWRLDAAVHNLRELHRDPVRRAEGPGTTCQDGRKGGLKPPLLRRSMAPDQPR
ncbi:hypothetical protein [Skermanella sp. TT6]